jgi:hypothetical protein
MSIVTDSSQLPSEGGREGGSNAIYRCRLTQCRVFFERCY